MGRFFKSFLDANELTVAQVSKETGIKYMTVWQWTRDGKRIGLKHLVTMSEYMGISIKELIEVEDNELHH